MAKVGEVWKVFAFLSKETDLSSFSEFDAPFLIWVKKLFLALFQLLTSCNLFTKLVIGSFVCHAIKSGYWLLPVVW